MTCRATRADQLTGAFSLGAPDALGAVAGKLSGKTFSPTAAGEQGGFTRFAKGPFAAASYVKKAAFPAKDGVRAAYHVLFVEKLDEAYSVIVDASTGAVLFRKSLVDHESEGTVYENFPGAPKGGQATIRSFGPTTESPGGYVDPTGAGLPGPTTLGNNASKYANYSNFLVPADQGVRPVSPTSQFNYVYGQNWQKEKGAGVPPSYALDLDPAATNLFWTHNAIHDEYYDLGFTETAGNFQTDGGDPILGLVHAGAATGGAPTYTGRDNAYMLTLPDGIPPWSGMFLWEPINDAFEGPYSDGNFDRSGYQTPRPAAPDLHYKSFTLASPTKASYVRFFIDSVQGETLTYAQTAELQVFGASAGVSPTAPPTDPDFTDQGTIATGNPAAGDPSGAQSVFGVTGPSSPATAGRSRRPRRCRCVDHQAARWLR